MKGFLRLGTGLVFSIATAVVTPVTALADCDGPVPSFRTYATSADRVVIGRVSAVDASAPWRDEGGASSRFTLRVEYTLRGAEAPIMNLRDLAYLHCADHILMVRKGDRIALALRASASGQRINTAAWIDGTPFPFAERISVRETFALFDAVPNTSTTPVAATAAPRAQSSLLILMTVFVLSLGLTMRRRPAPPPKCGSGDIPDH